MMISAALKLISDNSVYHLTRMGIKGKRCRLTTCPVARYLTASGFRNVIVTPGTVAADGERCDLPDSIMAFVTAFDCGKYPELEEVCES